MERGIKMIGNNYEVNGKTIWIKPTRSVFKRNIMEIKEDIYNALERIGIERDYVLINSYRSETDYPAEVKWEVDGVEYNYECSVQNCFKDNLGVISKIIKQDAYAVKNGMKSFKQVMNQFRLDYKPDGKKILSPRQVLELPPETKDLGYITYKYKKMAKELHPDTGGDEDKFKAIKTAFDELKKELEK